MIRVRALGECVIEVGDRRVGPDAATLFALLLYLALERGTHVARPRLVELLWPGASEERARHCLRQTLYKLRHLGAAVESTPSHVELPSCEVRADFLDLAAGGVLDVQRLRAGGAAFGEFLPGYAPTISPAFTEWLERHRDYAHSLVRRALSAALIESRARHRWGDVDAVARHCLRLDPLNEEATLALAEATAMTGSKSKALTILDRYVSELGADARDISLPASLLRRRIAERLPSRRRYSAAADAIFLGRDDSVELLAGLFREARAGGGRACLVWGDAGIGKSRLVAECTKAATLLGAQVARVGCQASDARRPLSAFVDLVPVLLALPGALGCSPTSMRYLKRLTEHDATATAPSEDAKDAEFLFSCVRQSLFDLVDAVASESTLVIVVEDVHWLDQVSWEVLREMIDWGASRRILFLFTSREENPAGAASERAPTLRLARHRLGALDDDSAATLLTALTTEGGRAISDQLREWSVAVAEGNPFFLNELARKWVETGDASRPPASLLGVLSERLSRLQPRSLRVLQACAVLGRNATLEHVEAVTQYARHELLDSLEELEAAHLLGASGSVVTPRHALIVEETLKRLPESVSRLLHRGAAQALSREIEATKSAAALWDCARHWRMAGEADRVHELVVSCATHLLEMGLPAQAAGVYHTALSIIEAPVERLVLLQGLSLALRLAGLWSQLSEVAPSVIRARTLIDPTASRHSEEEFDLLEAQFKTGGLISELLARALECVRDQRATVAHRLQASVMALRLADNLVEKSCADEVFRLSEAMDRQLNRSEHRLLCELIYHSSYGHLNKGARAADDLVKLQRSVGSQASLARALRYRWVPKFRLGDFKCAVSSASEAYAIAERYRMASIAIGAADDLASLYLEQDRIDDSTRWCRVSQDWARIAEDRFTVHEATYTYLRVLVRLGDVATARAHFPFTPAEVLGFSSLRGRMGWLAILAEICASESACQLGELLVAEMLKLYPRLRAVGGQDYSTSSLVSLLTKTGQEEMAAPLMAAYITEHRRERAPLPAYLRSAQASL